MATLARPLPPVQRPGTSQPKGARAGGGDPEPEKKLDASGSLKDAAALVRAQRAAR